MVIASAEFNGDYESDQVSYTLNTGDELVLVYTCGSYCDETSVYIAKPGNNIDVWTTMQNSFGFGSSGVVYRSIDEGLYYDDPGTYTSSVGDDYGDGPGSGAMLEVFAGSAGVFTAPPAGVTVGQSTNFADHPDFYGSSDYCGYYLPNSGYMCTSDTMSTPTLFQNNDANPATYEFIIEGLLR